LEAMFLKKDPPFRNISELMQSIKIKVLEATVYSAMS
jgi:hypothetical protein